MLNEVLKHELTSLNRITSVVLMSKPLLTINYLKQNREP